MKSSARTKKINKFFETFCKEYDFTPEELKGKCRKKQYSDYRSMFSKIAREWGFSLSEIGGVINRHHATVLHLSEKKFFDCELEIIGDFMIKYTFEAPSRGNKVGAKPKYVTSRIHISEIHG